MEMMRCEGERCIINTTGKTALEILNLSPDATVDLRAYSTAGDALPSTECRGYPLLSFADQWKIKGSGLWRGVKAKNQTLCEEFRVLMHSTYSALYAMISQTCEECRDLEYLLLHHSCLETCLAKEHHEGPCNEIFYFNILQSFHYTYSKECYSQRKLKTLDHHFMSPEEVRDVGKFYNELKKLMEEGCSECTPPVVVPTKKQKARTEESSGPVVVSKPIYPRMDRGKCKKQKAKPIELPVLAVKTVDTSNEKPVIPHIPVINASGLSRDAEREIERQNEEAQARQIEYEKRMRGEEAKETARRKKHIKAMKKKGIPVSKMDMPSPTKLGAASNPQQGVEADESWEDFDFDDERPRYQIGASSKKKHRVPKTIEEILKDRMKNPIEEGRGAKGHGYDRDPPGLGMEQNYGKLVIDTVVGDKTGIIFNDTPSFAQMLRRDPTLTPKPTGKEATEEPKMTSLGRQLKSHHVRAPQPKNTEEEANFLFEECDFPDINESMSESASARHIYNKEKTKYRQSDTPDYDFDKELELAIARSKIEMSGAPLDEVEWVNTKMAASDLTSLTDIEQPRATDRRKSLQSSPLTSFSRDEHWLSAKATHTNAPTNDMCVIERRLPLRQLQNQPVSTLSKSLTSRDDSVGNESFGDEN